MMERAFPLATALGVVWLSVCGVGAPPGHAKGDALLAIGPRGPTGADTPLSEAEKAQFAQRVTIAGGTAAEVQAACDRAAKEGVPVVFFPAGEYVFEAEVRVPGDLTLLGDGSKTLIRTRDRNSRLFSAAGDRVRFTRLKLQGADTTLNESNDTYGITISRAQNCRIDHCELLGFSYATTPREECTAQIDHCYIHHNLREGLGYGTSIYSGAYVLITDNEFEQNRHSLASNGTLDWSSPKHAGKYLHKPGRKTHWEFVHNRVRGNDLSRYELCAVDTHPGMDGTFVVEWNLFENLRHGVGIRDGSGVIRHNVFRNLRTVTKFRPLVAVSITYGLHNNVPVDGCMPRDITVEGNVCLMPEGVKFEKCQVGKAENIVVDGELVPATKVERPAPPPLPLLTPMDADGKLGIGQRDPVSRPAKTTKVTGQILDEAGKAVDAATVHIGSKSAATDANGHFAVEGIAEGGHVVAITKPGFEDALLAVTINHQPLAITHRLVRDRTPPRILGLGTSDLTHASATVACETSKATTVELAYGPAADRREGTGTRRRGEGARTTHSIELTGLQPNTAYCARVKVTDVSGNAAASEELIFSTAPAADPARPIGWGCYLGAGKALWGRTAQEAHTGKFSAFLKAVAHERGSLNIGLVVGDSDGYKGDKAHPAEPGATYQYRFWAKGDFKEARLGLTTWKAQPTDSKARQFAKLATFMPTAEWKEVKGEFKMPSDAKRFVLLFQVYLENLGREPLGVLYMDDVEVSAGKANLIKNAGAENE